MPRLLMDSKVTMAIPPTSCFITELEQRRQDFAVVTANSIKSASNTLVSHVTVLADWLWEIRSEDPALLIGASLLYNRQHLYVSNSAFACASLISQLCQRLNWHHHPGKNLIRAALTMDIGLAKLAQQQFQQQRLPPEAQQKVINHPSRSVRYLQQLGVRNPLWLQCVAEHHELLDGSGYPRGKTAMALAPPSRMLALIGRFVALVTPRQWRNAYGIPQALHSLANQSQRYDRQLLEQLALLLLPYPPGSLLQLTDGQRVMVQPSVNPEQPLMVCDLSPGESSPQRSEIRPVDTAMVAQLLPSLPLGGSRLIRQLWQGHRCRLQAGASEHSEWLKPEKSLFDLLGALQQAHMDSSALRNLLQCHADLGHLLVRHLETLYPGRKINDCHHALLMVGSHQALPLLTQLALQQQLQRFYFPAIHQLRPKVNAVLQFSALLSADNRHLPPSQAAMFSLLCLAPLYLDPVLQNQLPQRLPALADLSLIQPMSLMGCRQQKHHDNITGQLAKYWRQGRSLQSAIVLLQTTSGETGNFTTAARQLVAIFRASITLTHHIYHGQALNAPRIGPQLQQALQTLGLGKKQLKQILVQFSERHPGCELY